MKTLRILYLLLLTALVTIPANAEIIDRVVATAGDDAITLYDVEKEGEPLFKQIKLSSPPDELEDRLYEARKRIVEQLVEKVLLQKEARRIGIEVGDDEVDSAIERIKGENRISHGELLKALDLEGVTYDGYREEVKGQIIRSRVIDRMVRNGLDIGAEDIRLYYEMNRESFSIDEEIRARHILFMVPEGAAKESVYAIRKRVEGVFQMVKSGEDFEELARRYSEGPSAQAGGDLGFFKKGDMVKEFSNAAFELDEGGVSGLVLSPFGFHIIKLIERRGGTRLPLDEVKEEIREKLFSEEFEKGVKDFIMELQEREEVEIRI